MKNNWQGIYGQESVLNLLDRIIGSDKVPHALLFFGPDGVGKEFTAIRFSQALNQHSLDSQESDKINKQISSFSEPYIKYVIPLPRGKNETETSGPFEKLTEEDNENYWRELNEKIKNPYHKIQIPRATQIKISSIRDINKFLSYNFSDINYRIVLISDAHLMNEEAQNALLKNLEEPPEGIIFILTTMYPGRLRETIRSRCWQIPFQPLKNSHICEILTTYFNIDENISGEVSKFSGGSVTTALKLIEQDFELVRDKTIYILRYSFGRKYHSALNEFTTFLSDNQADSLKLVIQMIITWMVDVQHFRLQTGEYFFSKHIETLEKFNAKFPDVELQDTIFKLDKIASVLKNNVNTNTLILEIIFLLASLTSPQIKPGNKIALDNFI